MLLEGAESPDKPWAALGIEQKTAMDLKGSPFKQTAWSASLAAGYSSHHKVSLQQGNWDPGWPLSGHTKHQQQSLGENAVSQCLSQCPGCHLVLLPTSPNSSPTLSSSLVAFHPHWLSCYLSNTPHPFPPQIRCTCSLCPKGLASGFHGLGACVRSRLTCSLLRDAFPDHQFKRHLLQTCPIALISFLYSTYQYIQLFLYFSSQLFVSPTSMYVPWEKDSFTHVICLPL